MYQGNDLLQGLQSLRHPKLPRQEQWQVSTFLGVCMPSSTCLLMLPDQTHRTTELTGQPHQVGEGWAWAPPAVQPAPAPASRAPV